MTAVLGTRNIASQIFRLVVVIVASFLLFEFVSLYLSWPKQAVLGALSILIVLVLNRLKRSDVVTLALMLVSLAATLRYAWWRVHMLVQFFSDESNNRFSFDAVLMLILMSAEVYTILIMVLGFMQTSAPLRRKPVPLPADESLWPHVDVLIPTYNEPLSLVRYTALAAINIDYPPEKLHVYILDDGTRESFRAFAEEAGVGYIVREKHDHAKAGNINHALRQMDSPLVTIFDCDHVPTRSFLQVTVGWFLAQEKLAMLQTPHFFYSPDPFERNLLRYKTIPNEGELFYGVIQDGNDLWNATFFCGSCAVIRRKALEEVGGIATETVTEDAHTSLRMQKRGWNTAYINLPQAAGLATETLAAHVGQRVRWARGMVQIMRTDNPLFARGMKWTQRLCYFNAMLHFMYAVPRLIFLCAPLIYMLAGRTIIPGYWLAILSYAMPHLVLTSITNSRVQGRHRHSFWNEIYETVLAPYILLPTLLALINPKLGSFNVTDKGGTLSETTFDRKIATPTTWLLALNLLGVCVVPYRLLVTDPTHPGTVLSNLVWILFNMVILGVAAAVANEQQQRRSAVRISARIPVLLHSPEGTIPGMTVDMSVGGASLTYTDRAQFTMGQHLRLSFPMQTGDAQINTAVVGVRDGSIRLKFHLGTIAEEETLTCALYSRANSWISARPVEVDRPLISLARVVRLSFAGFRLAVRGLLPPKKAIPRKKIAEAVCLLVLLLGQALRMQAQIPGAQIPSAQIPSAQIPSAQIPAGGGAAAAQASDRQAAGFPPPPATLAATAPVRPAAAPPYAGSGASAVALLTPETAPVSEAEADQKITLADMGVQNSVEMHGPHSFSSVGFFLDHVHVPKRATLILSYHFSPDLLPKTGYLKVSLNGVPIARIDAPATPQRANKYASASLPLPADFLTRHNALSFEFSGGTLLQVESKTRSIVLGNIGATSSVLVTGDRVAFRDDLGLLPLPFLDADLQTRTTVQLAFLTPPSPGTLRAAGIVASWLGMLASAKPLRFVVSVGALPAGDCILLSENAATLPFALRFGSGGPSLSLQPNPEDPLSKVLVLAGDTSEQLVNVARGLSLMKGGHPDNDEAPVVLGKGVRMGAFPLPEPRKPDDAPRWLSTQSLTSLQSLSSAHDLQSDGSGPLSVYLRVPPDLDYGENDNLNLKLAYRYNALAAAPGSALRTYMNGKMSNETKLPPGSDFADHSRTVMLPVALMRPFSNTLQFNFDFVPAIPEGREDSVRNKISGSVLENSALDIRGMAHWATLPNLELFANAGFPFTRRADLADTVVVMPALPSAQEIALLLYLMSHCGAQTGYPALRMDVAGPDVVMQPDRDYLVLGEVTDQPLFTSLESSLPVTFDSTGIHVKQASSYLPFSGYWERLFGTAVGTNSTPTNIGGMPDVLLEGLESPFFSGRSIVVVSMRNDDAVETFADLFFKRSQSSDISNSVTLLRNGRFESYPVQTRIYHLGNISAYRVMRIWLADHFWLLLLAVTLLSGLVAGYIRDSLRMLAADRLSLTAS